MKAFWAFTKRYVIRYYWWYLAGIACIFLTQALMVGIIEATKNGIDTAGAKGASAGVILPYVLQIAVFSLLVILIRTASRLLIFTPGRMVEFHVRNDYYARLLFLQRDFHRSHESGDLVSRCSNDIGFVRGAYGYGGLQVANVSVTLFLGLAAMWRLDPKTTLYLCIPMLLALVIIQWNIHVMFQYWKVSNEQLGGLSSLCFAALKGVSAIQNYHSEPAIESRFRSASETYLETQRVVTRSRAWVMPIVMLVGNLSIFLVLLVLGGKVIEGEKTLGEITAFLGYIAMVMPPLLSLGWMMNVVTRALPAIDRLDEILLAEPTLPTVKTTELDARDGVRLEAKNLHFQFPATLKNPQPFVLGPLDVKLEPGKSLGIVGPVGSGKTVLLETLLRLNALESEQLSLNGVDAAHLDLRRFRDQFSFAPQKAWLFSATIRENLLVAMPAEAEEAPDCEARIRKALELACFSLDPKLFPDGLETQVGEKGVMLSGGQRQRIALARALLHEAPIYVLDDVLSAVDHETEQRIVAHLRDFMKDKSFVIASHRLSAVQWTDEILVLDQGRIVERGSHQELATREGFYRKIYMHQLQEPEAKS